ncbi:RNA polymerase sigma factor [bacterium 1xD42-87]|nr:RNA polymerase sigma factor [bacterium 1xD42-87]
MKCGRKTGTPEGGDMLEKRTDSPDQNVEEIFRTYGNMLYRIAFVMMKNVFDAEDVVQDTLIKYMEQRERGKSFETEEHRKAWLIRVDSNLCKNRLRFYKNHPKISVEQLSRYYEKEEDTLLMDSLLLLPFKYREVLLLHYVEGYQGREIAGMLGLSESAVRKRLERGREKLRGLLQETG